MARYRTLKPETFADEKLNDCPIEARFLFMGLWCFCDDMGRRQYFPRRIKLEVFPGDEKITTRTIDSLMQQLAAAGVLKLYSVEDQRYFWLPHFLRHQKIDRPSHSYIPAHPEDRHPECRCIACKIEREEIRAPRSHRNGRSVPVGTRRIVEDTAIRRVDEHSFGEVREVGEVSRGERANTNTGEIVEELETDSPSVPDGSEGNHRTPFSAPTEFATRLIALLQIPPKSNIILALSESIRIRAKADNCSIELAAQKIGARAAYLLSETPPEDWEQWFADARYVYVPQDDKRVNDRYAEARPVCGGALCSDGWEPVTVQGVRVLRRCPECARLWE